MGWSFLCRGAVCSQNHSLECTLHLEYWSSALQCKSRTSLKMAELAETHWVCFHKMVLQSLVVWIWLFFFWFMHVLVTMFDSFWVTRLLLWALKYRKFVIPASGHSEQPWNIAGGHSDGSKKLVPISVFTKSNIFTLGTSYLWSLCNTGHSRNPKGMKKWIRLDKESVFLGKLMIRLWAR